MKKRTFVGLCAALAFVAGSPGAHALKVLDTAPTTRAETEAGMDSVTYASETLLTTQVTDVKDDSTKYYNVGGTGSLFISLPGDVSAVAADTYLVSVALDGMVFRTALTGASLASNGSAGTNAAFTLAAGGRLETRRQCSGRTRPGSLTRHRSSTCRPNSQFRPEAAAPR